MKLVFGIVVCIILVGEIAPVIGWIFLAVFEIVRFAAAWG